MRLKVLRSAWLLVVILLVSWACNFRPVSPAAVVSPAHPTSISPVETLDASTPVVNRLLTVCVAQEPVSLFLYGDGSYAARLVRQAIYDGPVDWVNFELQPVILTGIPTQANGMLTLSPVSVALGEVLADINGRVVKLGEGVTYLPSGCNRPECARVYSGQEPAQVDQVRARFELRSGLQWSDGQPLTADDSVYSYEVALGLFPSARSDLLDRTYAYALVDETTVEWTGIPGYRSPEIAQAFFIPLPRHAWGEQPGRDLLNSELAARQPLGWGPYVIQEWTRGDHITLSRNAGYFRAGEGLPGFEKLVFRFIPDREQALAALLAGECDLLDESYHMEMNLERLQDLEQQGKLKLIFQGGNALEMLAFGLLPASASVATQGGATPAAVTAAPQFFNQKEVRQAVAQCLDRERLSSEFGLGQAAPPEAFVPLGHPLLDPALKKYPFDPVAANQLFEQAGWRDPDGNPATPRTAQGVAGVPDGTAFEVNLLISDEPEKQRLAQALKEMLSACGISLRIDARPSEIAYAPGPDGPVFGRNFNLAQFGWTIPFEPPCFLFTTSQIPGPYPQFPLGWGGANASGYSRAEFDSACRQASLALPGTEEHRQGHYQAQAIFSDDLPAVPLYWRVKVTAVRPDLCQLGAELTSNFSMDKLEEFNYGPGCQP